ncbi:ubiquitin-conjugating enzyme E2-binding protein [Aspergillus ambiguus]|uniref:HECT-type E3 ubiquitin transferase n=1 Tax=Aspergillus ambiguus TaxID=176160 RepID=UPI003CCD1216
MLEAVSMTETPPLYLHAELLPNIRHITLYISLSPTIQAKNIFPKITLSESRRAVSVSLPEPFDHVAETIKLPARVNEAARRTLTTTSSPHTQAPKTAPEYSYRMQIDDNPAEPLLSHEEPLDSFVPWTATNMGPSTRLRCRVCENIILDCPEKKETGGGAAPDGWVWKDLPSGNWAEMMDFWHCHKPDPIEEPAPASGNLSQEQSAVVKGYGAANRVVAAAGTVLVDVATFLVSGMDCRGLKQAPEEPRDSSQTELRCSACATLIGMDDPVSQGWRLFKTSLSAQTPLDQSSPAPWESHSAETVVAAQLLELIERESARRFVLHHGEKNGLLLWVFNPDLRYSNSGADHSVTAQRAMKVLFQSVADVDEMLHPECGKPSPLSLEELRLPVAVFRAVAGVLQDRNEMLPESARRFREWRVGIMHRYELKK